MKLPDTVTVAEMDLFDEIIDVRSPTEFAEDHIPGAASYPVLDDAERAEVGTLHKQVSPFAAKIRGAVLISKRIAGHIEGDIGRRPRDWRPLVYCWRGGKRSGALKHILREIGWQAATLEGGYKAYRRAVLSQLGILPREFRYHVVCGETGSAKSRILEAIAGHGGQVLDLERLANHRGSVLGHPPDSSQPGQRMFDSLLWKALRALDPSRAVFVESESKKVGEVHMPDSLMGSMRQSACIRIAAPVAARVEFLLREYQHFVNDPPSLHNRLDLLATLYPREVIARWQAQANAGRWAEFVEDMLANHYDPAYRRSMDRNFSRLPEAPVITLDRLDQDAIDDAARRIVAATANHPPALQPG
ncbi:MAG: tRNA 2-selenouridine(34) synthase MnmH [Burkholderiales bacterium]